MASASRTLISNLNENWLRQGYRQALMLDFYHSLTKLSAPALRRTLKKRLRKGKEDPLRLPERMGHPGLKRPAGRLAWFHAASVGEAQSTLILIEALLARFPDLHVLVTTGTVTSAEIMAQRLPQRAFHQFYPLDHPRWVERFISHWSPDMVFWMESELWPNMLRAIRSRNIHCVLVNARMSRRSYRRWKRFRDSAAALLSTFDLCLAQTEEDAQAFLRLRAINVQVSGNLKYSAAPLPCDMDALDRLKAALGDRPVWLYASTHDGEEELACRVHAAVKQHYPDILTIIAPRHPERRAQIVALCEAAGLDAGLRKAAQTLPRREQDIYIADTMGEMGLFYRLSPISVIGRSFSNDGGGGHNPLEAALLGSAVLHGPAVQNLEEIFAEMDAAEAAIRVEKPDQLGETLLRLLGDLPALTELQIQGSRFAQGKAEILPKIMQSLEPLLIDSGIMPEGPRL